jgi:hypothetical protein
MKKVFKLLKKFNKRNGEGHCILFFADESSILYNGEEDEIYMPTTLKQLKKFLKHN